MMNAQFPVLGVDVSKRKLDVALLVGGKTKSKVVANSPQGYRDLEAWLAKQKVNLPELHACLEATGVYSEPPALALQAMGAKVSVVNPACVKAFGQSENIRNKNDQVDAGLVARFCESKHPDPWVAPPLAQRQLRAWVDRVEALKDIRQQEMNRIEAHSTVGMVDVVDHVKQHIDWIDGQIKQLEKDIDDHIESDPNLKRDAALMVSIPGLGKTTVAKFLGRVGDVRAFDSAKALAAFIGVTPRQHTSGSSVRGRTVISRMGDKSLRTALYMPGLVARRFNPLLRVFADRLLANGMAKKAVIGAVMRKIVHQIYGVVTSGKPFDANYLQQRLANQDGI
jgi:transposase